MACHPIDPAEVLRRATRPGDAHAGVRPVYLGQHECSVVATDIGGGSGGSNGSNLIVGDEEGRVYFFRREDITWAP